MLFPRRVSAKLGRDLASLLPASPQVEWSGTFIRDVCTQVSLLGCQLPDLSPPLLILVVPEISAQQRKVLTNGPTSLSSLPSTTSLPFLNQIPTGHRTSTKPSQVHHPALSNRTLEFWLHFCCSSVIPPGRRSGAIAQELSVQTTNTKIPIPLVTSCVTLGSYFTPVCLNYEMRKTVPKHRIVMQMRGINALMQLRAMANIPQELKR